MKTIVIEITRCFLTIPQPGHNNDPVLRYTYPNASNTVEEAIVRATLDFQLNYTETSGIDAIKVTLL